MAFIVAVEGCLMLTANVPFHDIYSNFIELSPVHNENIARLILWEKLTTLPQNTPDADIVTVGDSSGFYGLVPEIVESQLQGGKLLNMNCCSDIGLDGYFQIVHYLTENMKNPRAILLSITPHAVLSDQPNDLSTQLRQQFILPSKLLKFPSMRYRLPISNLVFHREWRDELWFRRAEERKTWNEMRDALTTHRGWAPVPEITGRKSPKVRCMRWDAEKQAAIKANRDEAPSLLPGLRRIAEFTKGRNIRFFVVFNPVSCPLESNPVVQEIRRQMEQFEQEHPETRIRMKIPRVWDEDRFHDIWHLRNEGVRLNSLEVGSALGLALADR
ncbi:MAG: hypothetical protein HQL51_00210 [Magnetococcales bacterium]|nr:hypothetical protein [Magnetococcales bacterium]